MNRIALIVLLLLAFLFVIDFKGYEPEEGEPSIIQQCQDWIDAQSKPIIDII